MNKTLSTQPYKGTSDWLPEEVQIQNYIFDTWREVCLRFGYKEYLTPLLESADIYRAKSGEVKEELFLLRDRADRELALRPEMTPSVTRLIASIYKEYSKPIRFFSIASFYRNEATQKGRAREFWQLNADIFGDESIESDLEVICLALEIMLAFDAPRDSFNLYYNNRILLDEFFAQELSLDPGKRPDLARSMDKFDKLPRDEFLELISKEGLTDQQINKITTFLSSDSQNLTDNFPALLNGTGYQQIKFLTESLIKLGYQDLVEFKPGVIRGFDYYNGIIFEVYDLNPNNNRSLFGGGRYNGLSEIFGVENFPATGFAPGNITTKYFLENWNLLPEFKEETYFCPLILKDGYVDVLAIVNKLRKKGLYVELDLTTKSLTESLRLANKQNYPKIIILGENELTEGTITVKDLNSGEQETKSLEKFLSEIS